MADMKGKGAGAGAEPGVPAPIDAKPVFITGEEKAITPTIERVGESVRFNFTFRDTAPAAAFQRAGTVWLVFESPQRVNPLDLPKDILSKVASFAVDRVGSANVLRLQLAAPAILNMSLKDKTWVATVGEQGAGAAVPLSISRGVSAEGRTVLTGKLPRAGSVHWIEDPDAGDRLAVVTSSGPAQALPKAQGFVEVKALPTSHGFAFLPVADDVVVKAGLDEVTVSRDQGLTLSLGVEAAKVGDDAQARDMFFDPEVWRADTKGSIRARQVALTREASDAPKRERTEARLRLARFNLANGLNQEALIVLKALASEDQAAAATKPVLMTLAIAAVQSNRQQDAVKALSDPALNMEPEAALWRAVLAARSKHWTPALVGFRQALDILDRYPDSLNALIRPMVVDAAIEGGDLPFASQQLDVYERSDMVDKDMTLAALLRGRIAEASGRVEDALASYDAAAASPSRPIEARARLQRIILRKNEQAVDTPNAIAELETVSAIWRRDDVEVKALAKLGTLYSQEGRWRDAFAASRRAIEIMPDHDMTRGLQDSMATLFESIFLDGKGESLKKVEALGLFYDFKMFTPIGRRGDEIIRRLADRLAALDLLDQAGELLQHQVDNRLSGQARAQVAARLAVLYLMNRKPMDAVEALRASRQSDLPPDLKRARSLLEARALSELSRTDLAMEMLAAQGGEDVDRLRADVLWRGKRWREAGEAFEVVLGDRWQGATALTAAERADVLRAGISLVLADDKLGIDRLRTKFAPKMADSVDARTFALVTGETASRGKDFRDLARTVVSVETLSDFLAAYRKRYPGIAGAEAKPAGEASVRPREPAAESKT
jgi:tetratricopeptide (TPR) repeat protein